MRDDRGRRVHQDIERPLSKPDYELRAAAPGRARTRIAREIHDGAATASCCRSRPPGRPPY